MGGASLFTAMLLLLCIIVSYGGGVSGEQYRRLRIRPRPTTATTNANDIVVYQHQHQHWQHAGQWKTKRKQPNTLRRLYDKGEWDEDDDDSETGKPFHLQDDDATSNPNQFHLDESSSDSNLKLQEILESESAAKQSPPDDVGKKHSNNKKSESVGNSNSNIIYTNNTGSKESDPLQQWQPPPPPLTDKIKKGADKIKDGVKHCYFNCLHSLKNMTKGGGGTNSSSSSSSNNESNKSTTTGKKLHHLFFGSKNHHNATSEVATASKKKRAKASKKDELNDTIQSEFLDDDEVEADTIFDDLARGFGFALLFAISLTCLYKCCKYTCIRWGIMPDERVLEARWRRFKLRKKRSYRKSNGYTNATKYGQDIYDDDEHPPLDTREWGRWMAKRRDRVGESEGFYYSDIPDGTGGAAGGNGVWDNDIENDINGWNKTPGGGNWSDDDTESGASGFVEFDTDIELAPAWGHTNKNNNGDDGASAEMELEYGEGEELEDKSHDSRMFDEEDRGLGMDHEAEQFFMNKKKKKKETKNGTGNSSSYPKKVNRVNHGTIHDDPDGTPKKDNGSNNRQQRRTTSDDDVSAESRSSKASSNVSNWEAMDQDEVRRKAQALLDQSTDHDSDDHDDDDVEKQQQNQSNISDDSFFDALQPPSSGKKNNVDKNGAFATSASDQKNGMNHSAESNNGDAVVDLLGLGHNIENGVITKDRVDKNINKNSGLSRQDSMLNSSFRESMLDYDQQGYDEENDLLGLRSDSPPPLNLEEIEKEMVENMKNDKLY